MSSLLVSPRRLHPVDVPLSRWARDRIAAACAAAGVTLDGAHPWDPRIHRERALARILLHGTLGAGESYVDGDWDCDALDEMTARLLAGGVDRLLSHRSWEAAQAVAARLFNHQSLRRSRRSVAAHYDLGNELYAAMLGPTMAYSCGYWRDASTLDEAQDAKHDLIARKLDLRTGHRVLDIGCGWGGFARFAAERYGASVTGITLSEPQAALARERCVGLPVNIFVRDYRAMTGAFDRIVSIGMFEHVGPRNYRTFFETTARLLAPGGLQLLHTIGGLVSSNVPDPWVHRYIFPNAILPSAAEIARAVERLFVIEDWENFGADYDATLMAWHRRLAQAWPALGGRYDERFRRLWRYYLLTCAGAFRARHTHVWQLVLSPAGVPGGYRSVTSEGHRPCGHPDAPRRGGPDAPLRSRGALADVSSGLLHGGTTHPIHSFTHSPVHSFAHSPIRSFHSPIRQFTNSLNPSCRGLRPCGQP
jgi:cyclopropane-fatty-acyl-phospholipid synthase